MTVYEYVRCDFCNFSRELEDKAIKCLKGHNVPRSMYRRKRKCCDFAEVTCADCGSMEQPQFGVGGADDKFVCPKCYVEKYRESDQK